MNAADRELIIGMIADTLSPEESEAAHSRLASDPEFAAAHAEQVTVSTHLADADRVAMTGAERSDLRASLTEQLSLESAPPNVPLAPRRRFRIWQPIAGLAAVAAIVVGFVIIPGALPGSSDDAADTVATAEFDTESAPSSPPQLDEATGTAEAQPQDLFVEGEQVDVLDITGASIDDLVRASAGESSPGDVQRSLTDLGFDTTVAIDGSQMEQCLYQAESTFPEGLTGVVLFGAEESDGTAIAHFGLRFEDGVRSGLSIDLSNCEILTDND